MARATRSIPEEHRSAEAAVRHVGLVTRWHSLAPYLLSVLRIVAAFLFMQVGTAQLFALPAVIMPGGGTVPIASLIGIGGILQTFGGLFLLLGLFTRPVAFLLSGELEVAYLSAAGAGPWSLDAQRHRRRLNDHDGNRFALMPRGQ